MRSRNEDVPRKFKRPRLQQNIRNMFLRAGPKFVNAVGLQPVCRYCNRKFRAPQGLAVHIHMHERAGDVPMMEEKQQIQAARARPVQRKKVELSNMKFPPAKEASIAEDSIADELLKELKKHPVKSQMTRRFTIAEKLRIIEKSKEGGTLSETCR